MSSVGLHLIVTDPAAAAEFYAAAFGATETSRLRWPDGTILTIELSLAGTVVAVAGPVPRSGAGPAMRPAAETAVTSAAFHLPVENVDIALARAIDAGARVFEPVHDAFWGERTAQVMDPDGHRWALNQHLRDVGPDELAAALSELAAADGGDDR